MRAVLSFELYKRRHAFLGVLGYHLGLTLMLRAISEGDGGIYIMMPLFALLGALLLAGTSGISHLGDAAARGELGQTLFLPQGPRRVALAVGLATWALVTFLLLLAFLTTGALLPKGFADLARMGLYLSLSLAPALSGLATLAGAVEVAYHLGRVRWLMSGLVFVAGVRLLLASERIPWLWRGPSVPVSDLGFLDEVLGPGGRFTLQLVQPPAEWPLLPIAAGVLLFLLGVGLSERILDESEV